MSCWSSLDPWRIDTAKGHDIPFELERTGGLGVQYNGCTSDSSILNLTPGAKKKTSQIWHTQSDIVTTGLKKVRR